MSQHVNLTFSLKYLVNITKSTALAKNVRLKMSNEIPLLVSAFFVIWAGGRMLMNGKVSYNFGPGVISYYLAPKIGDE